MLKKKKFLFLAAFLVFTLVLVACGNNNDEPADGPTDATDTTEVTGDPTDSTDEPSVAGGVNVNGYADEFIIGMGGNIGQLDPHAQNLTPSAQVLVHVLNRLVFQDAEMNIHPELATSWEQLDDRSWQFELRDDVYFHNGDKLTANDVAFSFRRGVPQSQVEPVIGMIDVDGIEVLSDYSIIIRTAEPFAPFLAHLAHPAASILPESVFADIAVSPDDPVPYSYIIGSGPYRIVEHISGDQLVMERVDTYWRETPNIRRIVKRIIPEPAARTMALETGDVDAIAAPLVQDIARLEADPNVNVLYIDGLGVEYVLMNTEIISDPRVRQAINYASNGEQIVNVISEGTAAYATGWVNHLTFGHNPNYVGFPFDVERARELMIEAGYSGEAGAADLSFNIYANGENLVRQQAATILQEQLREIGIELSIQTPEFNTMMTGVIADGAAPMATLGWGTVTGDADYALFPLFHSAAIGGTNHARFSNADFDDLVERARTSTDPAYREARYWEAQEILREYAPWILLSNNVIRIPAQTNVRGAILMAHQSHIFSNVYFVSE